MVIIEEFFKKNNFDMPRIFIQDKISTKKFNVHYQLEKDYLFKFIKKMSVLKGHIRKNFFFPEDFEIDSSDSDENDNYSSDDDGSERDHKPIDTSERHRIPRDA
jgi:hypothetical protein